MQAQEYEGEIMEDFEPDLDPPSQLPCKPTVNIL
jgi:hypothetical protein